MEACRLCLGITLKRQRDAFVLVQVSKSRWPVGVEDLQSDALSRLHSSTEGGLRTAIRARNCAAVPTGARRVCPRWLSACPTCLSALSAVLVMDRPYAGRQWSLLAWSFPMHRADVLGTGRPEPLLPCLSAINSLCHPESYLRPLLGYPLIEKRCSAAEGVI